MSQGNPLDAVSEDRNRCPSAIRARVMVQASRSRSARKRSHDLQSRITQSYQEIGVRFFDLCQQTLAVKSKRFFINSGLARMRAVIGLCSSVISNGT